MAILNLGAFENTPLEHDPFDFVVAKGVMDSELLAAVNRDYPEIDLPANFKPEDLSYGPSFKQLLDEIDSAEFKAAIEHKFGVSLDGAEKTITVRKYSEMSDGNIHTDHWSKIITVLIYFNPEWTQEGGKLRFLRSRHDIEDYAAEVTPVGGTMLAFRRSNKSLHGYKRFNGERRMVQVNWVKPNKFAWYAQQLARFGTHTGKRLLRMTRGS
jgi:Rps23 Pro-64 3,4-dihydroxylase Tpa1-like proline 4-hydroxylase